MPASRHNHASRARTPMRAVTAFALWALAALLAAGEATISFKKATESVVESAGQVEIELDPKHDKNASITIVWRTVSGSALPGYDYVATTTTTVIPNSVKKPTVAVALIDDLANTGNRQFTVELVSATGATVVAAAAQCVVTITEDDTALPPAQVAAPLLTPVSGTFSDPIVATGSTTTVGAELRYRLDGAAPTASDPLLPPAGLAIDRAASLTVRGFYPRWLASPVASATYAFAVAPVTASLAAGTYTGVQSVNLASLTAGAEIRYTLDGSTPGAGSLLATGAIELPGSVTLKAIALRDGWIASPVFSAAYTLRVVAPTLSPTPGTFAAPMTIAAALADAQAVLRYTLDGTAPTVASPPLPADGLQLTSTATVRVIATRDGWANSAVVRATYTLRNATPVPSLPAGTYTGAQLVTLTSASPGAEIRYSLDGTTPTAASLLASGPLLIEGNKTLRAIAIQPGWSNSATLRATYALRVPAPQPTPAAGTYPAWPLVTVASSDALATVRYTTGATLPNAWSRTFPTAGLQLTAATTLNFVATRSGWTVSLPTTASYARDLPPVATAVSAATDEDVAVEIRPSASDVDSATLTWSIVSAPTHGLLSGFDAATGAATYTPATDWNGSDTYSLAVADALTTVAVPVTVGVAAVDDAAVITAPAAGSAPLDSDLLLSGFAVIDIDSPVVTVIVTVDAGTISLPSQATSGATWAAGVLSGSPAEVTAALADAVWRAPAVAGTATLTIVGNGASASVALTATAPTAPIAIAPLAATTWTSAPHGSEILPQPARFWNLSVAAGGGYRLWIRGAAAVELRVELDGTPVTGLALPAVTGWSCRTAAGVTAAVQLPAGDHRLMVIGAATIDELILVADSPVGTVHALPVVVGPGSVAVIEAEDYDEVAAPDDGFAWQPSGSGMRLIPDLDLGPSADSARLTYDLFVSAPGTYRIWARARGQGNSDSLRVMLDGQLVLDSLTQFHPTAWAWGSNRMDGGPGNVVIASAGLHTLTILAREDGVEVDAIAISGVALWTPTLFAAQPATLRAGVVVPAADGLLAVEAEAAHQRLPGGRGHAWTPVSAPDGVGTVLRILPDNGMGYGNETSAYGTAPSLTWHVRFAQPGTYAVWLRAAAPDANADSAWVSLDGMTGKATSWIPQSPLLPLNWTSATSDRQPVTVTVPTAGIHALTVWMREDGFVLDRVEMRPLGGAAPSGLGTPASPTADPSAVPGDG
ncbi:MAG TPA: hypothetical protein DCS97_10380 [Planctomycetes bacterium]|nr:hypothetical protein [Planctomycetota bacterium]